MDNQGSLPPSIILSLVANIRNNFIHRYKNNGKSTFRHNLSLENRAFPDYSLTKVGKDKTNVLFCWNNNKFKNMEYIDKIGKGRYIKYGYDDIDTEGCGCGCLYWFCIIFFIVYGIFWLCFGSYFIYGVIEFLLKYMDEWTYKGDSFRVSHLFL